jgi:poly(3-hydroxybutyrate) depolymerase
VDTPPYEVRENTTTPQTGLMFFSYRVAQTDIIQIMSFRNIQRRSSVFLWLIFLLAWGCNDSSDSGKSTTTGGSMGNGGSSGNSTVGGTGAITSGGASSATGGTTTTGGSNVTSSPNLSSGCGKTAPISAATQQTTSVNGEARSYFISPPKNYKSNTAYPLVFVFHGGGDNGKSMQGWSGLEAGATTGALFVYPDGLGGIWDLKNDGPDTKLFDRLVTTLEDEWCIDKTAIFAAGFSYGGWAATQLAVARPTVVRAVASIEGGGPQGGKSSDPAVAAMIIHGTEDTAEPIAAGISSRNHFVSTNGCGNTTSAMTPSPCVAYNGCKDGKSVAWCEHPGAHEIPSFSPAGIWNFFMNVR